MARLLALEWDDRELRIAVGGTRGSDVVLEQTLAVSLETEAGGSGEAEPSEERVARVLTDALATRNLGGTEALIAIGRANIELRVLTLPPAPPEEQPDLVRFQAMQAFTTIGEDWPLDYVQLASDEESVTVLAAAISPLLVEQIQTVCGAANLTAQRLVLRPFAAAALLRRAAVIHDSRCNLVVDRMANEADLSVIADGQVVLMRTVRLPASGGETVRSTALLSELRRTIGAAQNQLGGRKIEQVIVLGDAESNAPLEKRIQTALSLDVQSFNPLDAVRLARELQADPPTEPGRFTSLLGMLADEAAGAQHAVDFLHPRKRPEAPSQMRRNTLIGAAVAVVVLGGLFTFWFKLHQLDTHIADLTKQAADMDLVLQQGQSTIDNVAAIHEFTDSDITWLDELYEMARRLPSADDAILDEVTIGAHTAPGGIVTLKGHVKEASMIAHFEDSLRYDKNVVSGRQGTVDRSKKDYPWLLDTTMIVPPDVQDKGKSLGRPFRDQLRETATPAAKASEKQEEQAGRATEQQTEVGTSNGTPADQPGNPAS